MHLIYELATEGGCLRLSLTVAMLKYFAAQAVFVLTYFLSGIREASFTFKHHLGIYKLTDRSSNDLILSRQVTLTAGGEGKGEGVGPALTLHTAALHQLMVTAFGLCHSKRWQPWRQLQCQEMQIPSKILLFIPC